MLQIEPMTKCLHGSECDFLFVLGDASSICLLNRVPIFDMRQCPDELWWMDPEPFKDATPSRSDSAPGGCKSCSASGLWAYSDYTKQNSLCFYYAYSLGKPGRPKPCREAKNKCPKENNYIYT